MSSGWSFSPQKAANVFSSLAGRMRSATWTLGAVEGATQPPRCHHAMHPSLRTSADTRSNDHR